jgi:Domain of unknown function (DUF4407)
MDFFRLTSQFFQFLSKTDQDALNTPCCTRVAKMTQTSLGIMVLLTGVLAFFSGSYAIYTAFADHSWASLAAVPLGLLYCCIIIVFDREIVGSQGRKAVWVRLPLAIAIGFIVAVPLELRLLQDSIDKQLIVQSQDENKTAFTRMQTKQDELDQRGKKLQEAVQHYRDEVTKWNTAMEAETVGRRLQGRTGVAGVGPAYREAERNRDSSQRMLTTAEAELQKHEVAEKEQRQVYDKEYERRHIAPAKDFLARYEALETLKRNSSGAFAISWGLRIFFILIEIFPALLKLFLPYNEYNAIVEARRRSQVQLVHALGNTRLDDLGKMPPAYPTVSFLDVINSQP